MKNFLKELVSSTLIRVSFILLLVTAPVFASSYSSCPSKDEFFYKDHPPLYFLTGKGVPFSLNGVLVQVDIDGLITTENAIPYFLFNSDARPSTVPFQGYSPSPNEIKLAITAIKNGKTILFHQVVRLPSVGNSVHFDIVSKSSEPSILDKQAYNIHVEIKHTPVEWWCSLFETKKVPAYEIIVSEFKDITAKLERNDLAEQLIKQEKIFDELRRNYSELMRKLEEKTEKEHIHQNDQQTTEGTIQSLDLVEVQVGRYDCEHGNFRGVGSCNLTGPLKLYVYGPINPLGIRFIESFAVDINGVRHLLAVGKENVVECNQEGALKIDFSLKTYQARSGNWEKGKKHGKMHYYDNFIMKMKVEYQKLGRVSKSKSDL